VKKWSFVALLLVGATILGATVFREPIAWAAQSVDSTIVGPLDNGNVRVHEEGTANTREQNTDANGNIKVHEQGTANVKVTNSNLSIASPAPITDGGGFAVADGGQSVVALGTATALSIHMADSVLSVTLRDFLGRVPAQFVGPAAGGNDSIVLALSRPISFVGFDCEGAGANACTVSWVGDSP
jgi:hypothetical protein